MADLNPFDLLGDDDTDDPSQLLAAQQQKVAPAKEALAPATKQPGKLPSKPLPPAQAGELDFCFLEALFFIIIIIVILV